MDEIVINPNKLIIARDKAGELVLSSEAEAELTKILEAQTLIENIIDYVKSKLGEEMDKRSLIKIKAGSIVVSKRFYGTRYQLEAGAAAELKHTVSYDKPDIDAIDKYIEEKGELPNGVSLREREQRVSILKREEDL